MSDLPRWDLTNIFPSLIAPEFVHAKEKYRADLAALTQYFDEQQIRRVETTIDTVTTDLQSTLSTIIERMNAVLLQAETMGAYLHGLITTDSFDAVAAKEHSQFEQLSVQLRQLEVRFKGWLGSLTSRLPALIEQSPLLKQHRFFLEFTATQSRFLMSEAEESLAAELALDGGSAFGRLQGTVTSQLTVPWEEAGKVEQVPITMIRNLSFHHDAAVRERAYHVEQAGWQTISTTVAACLNGVKGTAITLAKHRGRERVLSVALEQNRIDAATLDALLGSIQEFLPDFRRYLTAKAQKMGRAVLPWWDLFAPLGHAEAQFSWSAARQFIMDKFGSFSPELAEYARVTFDQNWIDAEPRAGKRGGAYCMPVPGTEESRILANFDGSFEQLMTLAHELGHGYHNECQRGLPMLRRGTPSTLAETASIFCETIVGQAALQSASAAEQLMIIDLQLTNATQVCVDISSRYHFETAVMAKREQGELSADEFCDLMRQAQAATYGPAVDPATYHPYMWLWKPHYYSYEENFYNFPYAFGHLFGLGLYAIYQEQGTAFIPRYKELLRDTAQDLATPLAARFGLDIRSRDFWRGSLNVVRGWIDQFEKL